MFDLERAIAAWRQRFASRRGFLTEDLDELERHLRDAVAHAVRRGASEQAAFHDAVAEIGDHAGAEDEYRKVYWGKLHRQRRLGNELAARLAMFKNYLKTTLRSLARKKGYSAINIAGLTVGLACCLVIFQYVAFEYSFDRFHAHERDLYRLTSVMGRVGEEMGAGAYTSQSMGPALAEGVPEVARFTRLHPEYGGAVVSSPARPERVFEEERAFYVDPAFLEMFTFPLVAGDASLAPGTVLVSETAARKYFGEADPLGQVLDWTGEASGAYRVAGVLRDVPATSHLQFDFLLPMADLLRGEGYSTEPEGGWSWNNFATYLQLRPGADPAAVERTLTAVFLAHRGETLREQGFRARLEAQPLRDVHLNAEITGPAGPDGVAMGSYRTVYFFTVIGLVTLLIALMNYVNLATARALDRAREVGVRKAVGAQRQQLVVQFLFESALTNLAAAVLAVALASALTPLVNGLADTRLTWALWMNPGFWVAFLVTLVAGTLLAGVYPAFVLSSFRPATALKGTAGSFAGQLWLRRGLVVLQFAASVVLIGGTAVVYDQLGYMRRLDLGLDLEQVLTVRGPRVLPEGADYEAATATFVEELRRIPAVRQAARSSSLPGQGFNWNGASVRKAADDPANAIRGVATYIDTSFASLYGLELVAGDMEAFTSPPDSTEWPWALIPNETAVEALGFASPAEAVGQAIDFGGNDAVVAGVFRDFNWSSAHEERQNVFLGRTDGGEHVSLRVGADDLPGTIAAVQATYARLFPGNVFRYAFVDEEFDRQYRNDERFATLFTLFAGLAIAIACLGLFGLASFTTQQRTKEIGVRKVLGASVAGLVALLAREFLKLVVVAVVIASPVVYVLMQRWLEGFAYHVEIGPGVFLLVGALALLIALLTVAYQSIRAALADPTLSLRGE
jgi:putative ABC transport system permease protein